MRTTSSIGAIVASAAVLLTSSACTTHIIVSTDALTLRRVRMFAVEEEDALEDEGWGDYSDDELV